MLLTKRRALVGRRGQSIASAAVVLGSLLVAVLGSASKHSTVLSRENRDASRGPRVVAMSPGTRTMTTIPRTPVTPTATSALNRGIIAPLTRVRVGPYPTGLAVDERSSRVFVLNQEPRTTGLGRVSTLDSRTGRVLGTVTVGRGARTLAVDESANRAFVLNAGLVDPRSVTRYGLGSVSVLDATTGRLLRTTPVGDGPLELLVDERRGHVLVTTNSYPFGFFMPGVPQLHDAVRVLSAHTGALLHTIVVPKGVVFGPRQLALDPTSGDLFTLGGSDITSCRRVNVCVTRIDTTTGAVRATFSPPIKSEDSLEITTLALDPRAGRLLVHVSDGRGFNYLVVFATTTGRALMTTPLGGGPLVALVVDPRQGRAVVVSPPDIYGDLSLSDAAVFATPSGTEVGHVTVADLGPRGGERRPARGGHRRTQGLCVRGRERRLSDHRQ